MRRPPPPIEDDDEGPRTQRLTRKPTRRWCKGRQGIEHIYEEFDWLTFNRIDHDIIYVQERCTTCGRHGKLRSERREKDNA